MFKFLLDKLKYLRISDSEKYRGILNTNFGKKTACYADLNDHFDFYCKCYNTENDGPCRHGKIISK